MPRERERLNYKIYNATGRKVAKENRELERISENFRNLDAMANQKSIDKDKKVCLQIDRLIGEYDFDLLFDVGGIEVGIAEFKKLIDTYKEVHVELRRELQNYENSYPDFEDKLKEMTNWVINAKIEIKRRKIAKNEKEEDQRLRQREKLKTEERYFAERMNQDLANISEKCTEFVENMEKASLIIRT